MVVGTALMAVIGPVSFAHGVQTVQNANGSSGTINPLIIKGGGGGSQVYELTLGTGPWSFDEPFGGYDNPQATDQYQFDFTININVNSSSSVTFNSEKVGNGSSTGSTVASYGPLYLENENGGGAISYTAYVCNPLDETFSGFPSGHTYNGLSSSFAALAVQTIYGTQSYCSTNNLGDADVQNNYYYVFPK